MLALRAWRTRNSFKVPAGVLEPRQFLARGNSRRLFGNYAREHASYAQPWLWSRGNSWLAEIPGGFSETTPADKPCTPGRGPGAAAIPGLRKFPAAFWKPRPRTCLVHPAGGLEPRQSLARGNSGGFSETTPADMLLSTAKRCLTNSKPYLACSETMSCLQ